MILVTGFGSIGSLVVEKLLKDDYEVLVVDKDEKSIHNALTRFKNNKNFNNIVADISHQEDLKRIFMTYDIDKVIHTAAMKHVTFCEANPTLATRNNILGINSLLEESKKAGVKSFLNVSTDKAAYPSNVMGATKFIAERLVSLYDTKENRYQNVRLGNVLFSNGSLLPTIAKIVGNNQVLDLTDLDATRFFITQEEVSDFIVEVATFQRYFPGQVIIKKLQSATLKVMVDATLEYFGYQGYPHIKIMGLRKGEKLHEHLFTDNETSHIQDLGDFWSIDYNMNYRDSDPIDSIDSSECCVSKEEFLDILKRM